MVVAVIVALVNVAAAVKLAVAVLGQRVAYAWFAKHLTGMKRV